MELELPDFTAAKVLVAGDVMLDRYWHGDTLRISPEAPVPVVHVQGVDERPGGAGNVAINLAALGTQVDLLGVLGDDEAGEHLENKLEAAGVNNFLPKQKGFPTITKLRVLSLHQQLIRLDFEDNFRRLNADALAMAFDKRLADAGAVVLSDYGKGTLSDPKTLIERAQAAEVPVLIDPKGKDFSLYDGATLLTPNMREFEMVVGPCRAEAEIIAKAKKAIAEHNLQALLVTRGPKGMTLIQGSGSELHLPTQAREVFDVTGAGDTVIAMIAAALAAGASLERAVMLANLAAGIVVGKLGAATVSTPELTRAILNKTASQSGVMSEEQLLIAVEQAKQAGQRIIMTNGCFDILHAGHIQYLEKAKALGDRLIVAVNTDASVSRLKGEARPINKLEQRMAVLSGVGAVDWVVAFAEDTPERLIENVLPDVLVKGGDYDPETIAGGKAVRDNGGEVKVLEFVEGCSTTNLVKRIQQEER